MGVSLARIPNRGGGSRATASGSMHTSAWEDPGRDLGVIQAVQEHVV